MLVLTDNWNTTYFLDNNPKIDVINMFNNTTVWEKLDEKYTEYMQIGIRLLDYATDKHINIWEHKFDVERSNKERIRILFDCHKFNVELIKSI